MAAHRVTDVRDGERHGLVRVVAVDRRRGVIAGDRHREAHAARAAHVSLEQNKQKNPCVFSVCAAL